MGILIAAIGMAVARDTVARRGSWDVPFHDASHGVLAVAIWFLVAFYVLYGNVAGRTTRFHLSLPVSARRLWLSHVISLVLGMSAIFAVALFFVGTRSALVGVQPLLGPLLPAAFFRVGSALLLAIGLVQLVKPELHEIPMRVSTVVVMIAIGAIDLIVLIAMSRVHPLVSLVPLTIGVGLLGFVYMSLPASLSIASREPARGEGASGRRPLTWSEGEGGPEGAPLGWSKAAPVGGRAADARTVAASAEAVGGVRGVEGARLEHAGSGRRLVHRTVAGLLMRHWGVVLFGPWAIFLGFYLSGAFPDGMSGPIYVAVAWACMNGPFVYGAGRLSAVDHLPVSRKIFFAYLMIPTFAVIVVGLVLGSLVGRGVFKEDWLWDRFLRIDGRPERAVPHDFLEVAWNGDPPPVTSPWGEEHEPWRRSVFGQSDVVVYRPYDTPPDASPEFVAHQIARALHAMYGSEFPVESVERRYVRGAADCGCTHWSGWHHLVGDYERSPANAGALLPLMCAVVGVPWFLFVRLALWASHGAVSKTRRILPAVALGGAVALFTVGIILVGATSDLVSSWVVTAFAWILLRSAAQAVPGGTPALWLLCVGALAASYLFAQSQFLRSEAPLKRGAK
jgi:hypothetical protein